MTGQIVSPRAFAASISSTRSVSCFVMTPQTSSTVRPDAAMRARIAALISRVAAFRSSGVDSQCGNGGACVVGVADIRLSPRKDCLLDRQDTYRSPFRQESFLESVRVPTTKPTLELLRALSDEHVLRALMAQRRATRAEIAASTGLSKPTVSESVRRLSEAGKLLDTGERTTGRGRIGTYYALAPTTGRALVAGLAPEGIVAEAVDVYGDVVARTETPVTRSPGAGQVADTLESLAREIADGPFRLAVVSAADPVDRETGRLVALPD